MAARSPQTQAKRARELAVKERRERKQAKKEARRNGEVADVEPSAQVGPDEPQAD